MALFCDTFNHFKVEAWLNDPGFNSDSPQFGSNSPPGRKRKRISGRVHSPSRAATPRSPISPRHPCAPTQARRPLQATTRSNMAARAGQDADPIKSPTKPLMTRATPTTLPNRPRRQSPRKTAAPSSSVRTAKGEATVTSRRRVLQDNTGAELRGRPPVDFDPQIQDYARTLSIVRDIFPPLTATESQSSKQTRSTSPSKTMHDLAMADPPIRFYEARSIRPPEEVAKLYQRISHTCRGSKLLPHSVKDEIMLYSQSEYMSLEDFHFQDEPKPQSEHDAASPRLSPSETTQEDRQIWKEVKHIALMALKCSQDNACEAAWGERVYSRIFYSALEAFRLRDSVGWENITTARIEPRGLTPKHLTGKTFSSKMVDYALVLLPDETMHRAILDVLRQSPDDEDHNINQTRSGPVRFRPITANIEVKVPGEGRNQTMVQLAVWVTAQFKKLNALTGGRGAVQEICIPLISVEGHDWRIYIAYQTADGEVVIWGNQVFGDTASVLGIYRVIAGLRTLVEWSHLEYRAWFEREVLQVVQRRQGNI